MVEEPAPFDRLHSAVQHHILNSLGWPTLRPLQEKAIEPILAGDNALLVAPTATGKTEAAVLPLLSRMLTEEWHGLAVLYVCPLRALLNNLHPRIEKYAGFVGRRAGLWHGDTPDSVRRRILAEPPDVLLTTPESLEVMLVSKRVNRISHFANLRAVVIDELHAFAGDDRGWHLLSVIERLSRLAGRDLQRVGLSATVGNPEGLLGWLSGSSRGGRRTIAVPAGAGVEADVRIDHVDSMENAAYVLARLYRDEKRLVFCDSRTRVEDLTFRLREAGVEAYASHSSLAAEERLRAEEAFASSGNAVIVATSTLELGIDIGDLDRVIQIDAPYKVASFLQRMGRTGRRAGTKRNYLFLTTKVEALLVAAGLVRLWASGFVEPVLPPVLPYHIVAQQLLALVLQNGGGMSRGGWEDWIAGMPGFRDLPAGDIARIEEYLLESGFLMDDGGLVSFGPQAEESFGRRNFLELLSAFTSDPLFSVRYGSVEVGRVDAASFQISRGRDPVLLLGGRAWHVTQLDWSNQIAYVEPGAQEGRSIWFGDGPPLSFEVCQSMRAALRDPASVVGLTKRGAEALASAAANFETMPEQGTYFERAAPRKIRGWTFAGLRANAAIADRLSERGIHVLGRDNLSISVRAESEVELSLALGNLAMEDTDPRPTSLVVDALDGLKFSACVPRDLAMAMLAERLSDEAGFRLTLGSEDARSMAG